MSCIYAIGETVLDIVFKEFQPQFAIPGGSALNTAISLGRLGNNVFFISELGDDTIGDETISFLQSNGVNANLITRYANIKTSLAIAFLDSNGDAKYSFYKNLPYKRILPQRIIFKNSDIVLFSSSFAVNSDIRKQLNDILSNAIKSNALVYYDPNVRFNSSELDFETKLKLVFENFALAHIVRGSDEDFKNIFNVETADDAYLKIKQYGCHFFIYTQNSIGVTVFIKDKRYFYKSISLVPVSTIGAGDSFNAGILNGLDKHSISVENLYSLTDIAIADIVETAIDAASFVCQSKDNYISSEFAQKLLRRF